LALQLGLNLTIARLDEIVDLAGRAFPSRVDEEAPAIDRPAEGEPLETEGAVHLAGNPAEEAGALEVIGRLNKSDLGHMKLLDAHLYSPSPLIEAGRSAATDTMPSGRPDWM